MRTIAELPHPKFKITIFSMNQKYIIKFEQSGLEQSYKISEMDVLNGVDGVFELLDDDFYKQVESTFENMRITFKEAYERYE